MRKDKVDINRMFFSFLIRLGLITLLAAITYTALIHLFPSIATPSRAVSIFLVLFAVTAGIHYLLLRAGRGEAIQFPSFMILSMVIKLFLYAIFTFLLILSDRQGAMANVVLFFVVYIILTVFEITTIYSQLNRIKNN